MKRPITAGDVKDRLHTFNGWDQWRVCAWHDTFNAVLSGAHANPNKIDSASELIRAAYAYANEVHGKIPRVDCPE